MNTPHKKIFLTTEIDNYTDSNINYSLQNKCKMVLHGYYNKYKEYSYTYNDIDGINYKNIYKYIENKNNNSFDYNKPIKNINNILKIK